MPRTFAGALLWTLTLIPLMAQNSFTPYSPRVVARVALVAQTNPIPTTTIFTPTKTGLYRISAYGVETIYAKNPGSEWSVLVNWTDDFGAEVCANLLPCTLMLIDASGGIPYGTGAEGVNGYSPNTTTVLSLKAGTPLTMSVSGGDDPPQDGQYELYMTVEQME